MTVSVLDVLLLTPGPRGRLGLPAVLWGPPGAGKTSQVEQAVKRRNLHQETVILSLREPADVAGLPVPQANGSVVLAPPGWATRLASAEAGGLLFLDELSCATPTVQAAALRVVAEGVVGDFVLPPHVRVLCAANPEDQAAGGWALAAPMANRLIHIDYELPTAEKWGEWLLGDGQPDTSAVPQMHPASWDREWARARADFASFARRFPQHLLDLPKDEASRGRAWPSPRSLELAARAVAGARALGADQGVILKLLHGAVGDGVGNEAWAYFLELDLPDPEEVLAGQAKVPLTRTDRTFASLAGVCNVAMLDRPDRKQRLIQGLEVAAKVAEKHADVAASCVRAVLAHPQMAEALREPALSPRYVKALTGSPLMAVAGMLRGNT